MLETEMELFYVDGRNQFKDVGDTRSNCNKLKGLRPRIITVHQNLLNKVGLFTYLHLCDILFIMDSPHKVIYFISDGQDIRSEPLSLKQLMQIQMGENGKEYMSVRY